MVPVGGAKAVGEEMVRATAMAAATAAAAAVGGASEKDGDDSKLVSAPAAAVLKVLTNNPTATSTPSSGGASPKSDGGDKEPASGGAKPANGKPCKKKASLQMTATALQAATTAETTLLDSSQPLPHGVTEEDQSNAKVLLRHLMVYSKSRRRNMLALKLAASVAHPVFGGLSGIWKEWKAARSEAADSSTPRGRDKDAKKSKGNAKPAAKNAKDDEILWDLNLRVEIGRAHV